MNTSGMDGGTLQPQNIHELLRAVQAQDAVTRQAGEKQLDEFWASQPDWLAGQLNAVLAAGDTPPNSVEIRQEAVVLMRHCIAGIGECESRWSSLQAPTREAIKTQVIASLQHDPSTVVRRSVGSAASAIVDIEGSEDFSEVQSRWPQLLPALSALLRPGSDSSTRIVALGVLKELAARIGDGVMEQGAQVVAMLQSCLGDSEAGVRAAGAQLVLQLIAECQEDHVEVFGQVMPTVITLIECFAGDPAHQGLLKEVLETLQDAADQEPEYFKDNGFLMKLWPLLMSLCSNVDGDLDVRRCAMEAMLNFVQALLEDFCCKPEGKIALEQFICLNLAWMLEVEESVEAWTKNVDNGDNADDDDLDGDIQSMGQDNLDTLAENCKALETSRLEEVFMPMLFKCIRVPGWQGSHAAWKGTRAAVAAVSYVVEHIDEEAWVDECVNFSAQLFTHDHPRVRHAAFYAVVQLCLHQSPYIQESHHSVLLTAIISALDDSNIRVATEAVEAFSSFGEELEFEVLEPHLETTLTKLMKRLQVGETRDMQEACLAGFDVIGEVAKELFIPYYTHIMPVLKQIIARATGEKDGTLRGKAFECASIVGEAVGKDTFLADAHEIMQAVVKLVQAGFDADDTSREYIEEVAGRVAKTIKQDFKPYVPGLLPFIFKTLAERPKELDEADFEDIDEDNDDMRLMMLGDKAMGIRTAVLDEMRDSIGLITTLIEALESDYIEFLPITCQNLQPLLGFTVSHEVSEAAFKTWSSIANCARSSCEAGKCSQDDVRELLGGFLKATIPLMGKSAEGDAMEEDALAALQSQASGVSDVIRNAGLGVLTKQYIEELIKVLVALLGRISIAGEQQKVDPATKKKKKNRQADNPDNIGEEEDSDAGSDDEEEARATPQSVRFCLVDVAGAMMKTNPNEFVEVGLPTFMEFVAKSLQPSASEADRSLALYVTDDVVDHLGAQSVPYWNLFMEQACRSILDKSAEVRQYACSTMGCGARQPIFAQIAALAVNNLAALLKKHGERHRRRRAVDADARQVALSVDSAIKALGLICENQEKCVGGDCSGAWKLWLNHLPLRYDHDDGQKVHEQLLKLVVNSHPVVTSTENLPRVLAIFADIYKTAFSNSQLDSGIVDAVTKAGSEKVQALIAGLPERQQHKVQSMMKDGQAPAL